MTTQNLGAEIERLLQLPIAYWWNSTERKSAIRIIRALLPYLEKADVEMLRVKMCEHIAEGEEGWNKPENRNLCPSTMAVAELRDKYEALLADNERMAGALVSINRRVSGGNGRLTNDIRGIVEKALAERQKLMGHP